MNSTEEHFWSDRYKEGRTGWDIGSPSTPLKTFIDGIKDKSKKILIPGAGNAYEAEYAWKQGFTNIHVLDISSYPLEELKKRSLDFPRDQLHKGDFFSFEGQYDIILEQTFFCSFLPTSKNREAYAQKVSELLVDGGILAGVLFNFPVVYNSEKRPFGGSKEEYMGYFDPLFSKVQIEDCYNSIRPREGNEYFIVARK